jgi:hypothetical protein
VRKIDWRLCTIAGVLCSLNLLDRSACPWLGLIWKEWSVLIERFTAASFRVPVLRVSLRISGWGWEIDMWVQSNDEGRATSWVMWESISILVYTVTSVSFQLPSTILVRMLGPRLMFSFITVGFGITTMVRFCSMAECSNVDYTISVQLLSPPGSRW